MRMGRPISYKELSTTGKIGLIDIYYGDESHISAPKGYVPHGWQFRGEDVPISHLKEV